jgi:hypothetical protein
MPIINLVPTTYEVEFRLNDLIGTVRDRLKSVICLISDYPIIDVLVNLLYCPYRNADPNSADLIVYAETCPDEKLEARADELRDAVARVLNELGFTTGQGTEVWPRFIPGSWCLIKNDTIVDSVSHVRA